MLRKQSTERGNLRKNSCINPSISVSSSKMIDSDIPRSDSVDKSLTRRGGHKTTLYKPLSSHPHTQEKDLKAVKRDKSNKRTKTTRKNPRDLGKSQERSGSRNRKVGNSPQNPFISPNRQELKKTRPGERQSAPNHCSKNMKGAQEGSLGSFPSKLAQNQIKSLEEQLKKWGLCLIIFYIEP